MEPSKYHLFGNEYDFNKDHGPNFETNSSRSDYKLKHKQWTAMDQEALDQAALMLINDSKNKSLRDKHQALLDRKLELMQGTGGKSRRTRRKCRNPRKKSRCARRKSRHARK